MKFVFDSNVLISAALFRESIPGLAYKKAIKKGKIIISNETFNELKTTLNKPKLKKYLTVKNKLSFLVKLKNDTVAVEITQSVTTCRDPKDNMYLELALSGKADAIITGDTDLLNLHPFRTIPVISPKEFLDNY